MTGDDMKKYYNPLGIEIPFSNQIRRELLRIIESLHPVCKNNRVYVYEIADEYNKNKSILTRLSNTAIGYHLNKMGLIATTRTYGAHPKGGGYMGRIVTKEMIDKLKNIYH